MEAMQRKATTDVIFSGNLDHDFSKCCEIFTNNDHFIINGNIREKQLWAFPHLVKYFISNEANQAIIKLAFDTIELNRQIDADNSNINTFVPFHGTRLRKICEDLGLIKPETIVKSTAANLDEADIG